MRVSRMSVLIVAVCSLAAVASRAADPPKADPRQVKHGEYMVSVMGCDDCHTNKDMGPDGPELDMKHRLSGHLEAMVMPSAPALPTGPWAIVVAPTLTAWHGPWGTSFTRNLTPDKDTGLGDWTEQNFIDTIRTGRRLGKGRVLLPPMPIPAFKNLTDEDLKAIFAYLRTLPAVKNMVPEPLPPGAPADAPARAQVRAAEK